MKRRRGMVAFYLVTGVVLALFTGGWFAWTPLKVRYWERELAHFMRSAEADEDFDVIQVRGQPVMLEANGEETIALDRLLEIGPPSAPALHRVLTSLPPRRRASFIWSLSCMNGDWLVPVFAAFVGDDSDRVAVEAIGALEFRVKRSFFPGGNLTYPDGPSSDIRRELAPGEVVGARKTCLDWWQREGKARYGSRK